MGDHALDAIGAIVDSGISLRARPYEPRLITRCRHCNAELVRRTGQHGEFMCCPNWGRNGCPGTQQSVEAQSRARQAEFYASAWDGEDGDDW